ncbi:fibroblast growth factor receptor 1-like isoform X1 [Hydra vulgaris]|uniref:fibroblast growth factor receptor 1-like isoform X1 n=1 Tax=Hydra vulgaris TaxID=6087 RepID=UPI001F5EB731|nr:fibroblast growth factor receptor 1-like isoform X1 [Hydra vulgaris]
MMLFLCLVSIFSVHAQDSMPIIKDIPDVYLALNQNYSISCETNVTWPITWSKVNGVVTNNNIGKLVIINMKASDAGVYTCKVQNPLNSMESSDKSFTLHYVDSLKWIEIPKSSEVIANQNFSWTASIISPSDKINFVWLKDGNIMEKIKSEENIEGAKYSSRLLFKNISIEDFGKYRVIVENMVISGVAYDMSLKVKSAPYVEIEDGTEIKVKEGESISITCLVNAYPIPFISWSKNETIISIEKKPISSKNEWRFKYVLPIKKLKKKNVFVCTGNNSIGSSFASIIVNVDVPATKDSTIAAVVAVSVFFLLVILFLVIFYFKYKDTLFIHLKPIAENGQFYTDLIVEEKNFSDLHELENNPHSIKKNINISIRRNVRATIKQPNKDESGASKRLLPSIKREQQSQENHSARLGSLICQGKSVEFKHIVFDEILGSGEYGHVSGGRIIDEGDPNMCKDVSIKMLHDNASAETYRDMLNELRMMRRVSRHPNVISLIGWCITDKNLYVLEEYAPFGCLLTFLRTQRLLRLRQENLEELPSEDQIDEKTLLSFSWQIASGMKHLAGLQIVHRDLACRNIYLGHEKVCKISEYGLTRDIYAENVYRKNTGGQLPVRWMAYEAIFESLYTEKSDVWSFGILLWELISLGKIPYPEIIRTEELLDVLESGYHMENPGHISTDFYLLMNSCWNKAPENRPSFSSLVKKLAEFMNDKDEMHVNLNNFFKKELDNFLQDEEVSSPTTDFHKISPFDNLPV